MLKSYDRMTPTELVLLLRQQDRIIDSLVRELKRVKAYKTGMCREARRAAGKKRWAGMTDAERKEFTSRGGLARAEKIRIIKQTRGVHTNGAGNGTPAPDGADYG